MVHRVCGVVMLIGAITSLPVLVIHHTEDISWWSAFGYTVCAEGALLCIPLLTLLAIELILAE